MMITRSEAARARARPCPVSPDALLALLDEGDAAVGQLLAGSATVASLIADMVTRKDYSVKQACGDVRVARAALAHSTERVAYCARRRVRLTAKRVDSTTEVVIVTVKQLRVWGLRALVLECVREGVVAGYALVALRPLAPSPVVAAVCSGAMEQASELGHAARIVTGDGLRVVSAAGPGLKWFEPHSRNRNEFSVVLAQADCTAPVWLTTGDIALAVLSIVTGPAPAPAVSGGELNFDIPVRVGSAHTVPTEVPVVCRGGHVHITFEVAGEAVTVVNLILQVALFGSAVADADGDNEWVVRVPRKPLAESEHACAALGTHVQTLTLKSMVDSSKMGMAVSPDERWLVVGLFMSGKILVYSLPGGALVRAFGEPGSGPLQFKGLRRLCFAPNGNVIVVDSDNKRLQEVTLEGEAVRFLGVGAFGGRSPYCVAVHDDVIAVGCTFGGGPPVVLLDIVTGTVTSRFAFVDHTPSQPFVDCSGIRFTRDGSQLMLAESQAKRVSIFTTSGVLVRRVGVGVLGEGPLDVLQSAGGEYVVADVFNFRVCVFSPDGSELVRDWASWDVVGTGTGSADKRFSFPAGVPPSPRWESTCMF